MRTGVARAAVIVCIVLAAQLGEASVAAKHNKDGSSPSQSSAAGRFGTRTSPNPTIDPAALFQLDNIKSNSCITCRNGAACCDAEICCSGGSFCCPASSACCNDTCCDSATESCCPDPKHGGVCCMKELTFCCPPGGGYPSRCCPRWNVCCFGGRFGCCDPDTMEPVDTLDEIPKKKANVGYALYVDAFGTFQSLTIDLSSGDVTSKKVSGFKDWGEIQRVFMFDPNRRLFYLLQADFLKDGSSHSIYLYTVDPVAGTTVKTLVRGAVEEGEQDVPGFNFNAKTGRILFSTEVVNSQNRTTGYNFYTLNPTTAVATLVSTFTQTVDQFAGWFHTVSADGKTVYRVGYQDVINQQTPGLGITDISRPVATTRWEPNLPVPNGLGLYMSLNLIGGGNFISLAPDDFGDLAVVQWSISPRNASLLSQLYDAYNTPYFGPLVEYVNTDQTLFGALVVYNSDFSKDLARWALVLTDLERGTTQELVLWPWILAQTDSVAALGIP